MTINKGIRAALSASGYQVTPASPAAPGTPNHWQWELHEMKPSLAKSSDDRFVSEEDAWEAAYADGVSQGVITIDEATFVDTWGARVAASGDLLTFDQVRDLDPLTVWSIVTCEPNESWIACAGLHVVNRIGYAVTTKRWTTGAEQAYWYRADLPYGVRFAGTPGEGSTITSELQSALVESDADAVGMATVHALESLLLALYEAGAIRADDPAVAEAINTAVDAIGNHRD